MKHMKQDVVLQAVIYMNNCLVTYFSGPEEADVAFRVADLHQPGPVKVYALHVHPQGPGLLHQPVHHPPRLRARSDHPDQS